jgi:hypothetical protein
VYKKYLIGPALIQARTKVQPQPHFTASKYCMFVVWTMVFNRVSTGDTVSHVGIFDRLCELFAL